MQSWQPSASIEVLTQRASILAQMRSFFAERGVLEVETPLLMRSTVTDPFVHGIPAQLKLYSSEEVYYLQTSPEYAMKRLLVAGSGCIYQISKAFRQGDLGTFHHPEFTLLEWYRMGFDHHALMNEVDELLQKILKTVPAERITYKNLFLSFLEIDPHTVTESELKECARKNKISLNSCDSLDKDMWLDILLTHCIEPYIGKERPLFLYDFPATKAALAKIRVEENERVASRFEVYYRGVELANGFHELQDAEKQRKRFQKDLDFRREHLIPLVPIDELFLSALHAGLPDCSGVALGVDRLIMLAMQKESLSQVISFVVD